MLALKLYSDNPALSVIYLDSLTMYMDRLPLDETSLLPPTPGAPG